MKIAVACGGTGGHVFPGLATARVLRQRGHTVTLWTTGRAVENEALAAWDGPRIMIPARGLVGVRGLGARVRSAVALVRACARSLRLMRRERPDRLLAMGSYASVGPALAARCLRIPLVVHEANAVPGHAVRLLSRWAAAVAVTFPTTVRLFRDRRVVVTGLPLRPELTRPPRPRPSSSPFTVLVMGGSQGAHRLNEIATEALIRLSGQGLRIRVIHLTGRTDEAWVRGQYSRAQVEAVVHGFLHDMTEAYDEADLAVSRAGAGACMELALRGVPCLLVPFPWSAHGDQMANARALEQGGGAEVLLQEELTVARLMEYLKKYYDDRDKLSRMRVALRSLAISDAAERLADLTLDLERSASADPASPPQGA